MTWKRTCVLLTVIWLLSIVNANLVFFNTEEVTCRILSCHIINPTRNILNAIIIYIPSVGLLYFNYKIYEAAKRQRRKIRRESCVSSSNTMQFTGQRARHSVWKEQLRQLKILKTFSIVLGAFYICILPTAILTVIRRDICKSFCVPISVTVAAIMLAGANSVINPFIYSLRNKEYRVVYRQFFSRLRRNKLFKM